MGSKRKRWKVSKMTKKIMFYLLEVRNNREGPRLVSGSGVGK